MSKKEEAEKFEKVPQIEIDGELYHESAQVVLGLERNVDPINVEGNIINKVTWSLKKLVIVRNKVAKETTIRSEEGPFGKETVKYQWEAEIRKEIKRLEK